MAVQIKKPVSLGTLSLTPLIDVVFLMLIFFLVATRFEQEEREMDINLPQASEARPMIETPTVLYVNITKDGKYYVHNQLLDREALEGVFEEARLVNQQRQRVVIRADESSAVRFAVDVMDACEKAKIPYYTLATE